MLTTRDALAVIGAISLLRLAWTALRARLAATRAIRATAQVGLMTEQSETPAPVRNVIHRRLVMRPLSSVDLREVEPAHRRLGEPPSFGGGR